MNHTEPLLELLPTSVAELVEIIGFENALLLVNLYGGTHLEIPKKAKYSHWLVGLIGFEAFKKLCYRYGSTQLEIARCVKLLKAVKHQTIVKEFNSGMTNAQLARKYQTDERSIRRIKNKLMQEKVVNLDLFKEVFGVIV